MEVVIGEKGLPEAAASPSPATITCLRERESTSSLAA